MLRVNSVLTKFASQRGRYKDQIRSNLLWRIKSKEKHATKCYRILEEGQADILSHINWQCCRELFQREGKPKFYCNSVFSIRQTQTDMQARECHPWDFVEMKPNSHCWYFYSSSSQNYLFLNHHQLPNENYEESKAFNFSHWHLYTLCHGKKKLFFRTRKVYNEKYHISI